MMDKLKMHSPNLTEANIAKLAELFPSCVTEARDEQGRVKQAIDFDQLRQELSDHIVEGPQERYHLNWPGKREALLAANSPIAKTLRPCREESVDFDTTKNLFIEGDNLEALKLLQENYLGRVKVIYIDPPYNTGSDLVYKDSFSSRAEEYLVKSGQRSSGGESLVINKESNGRFHSDWLSMIYPRIKLSRNLLKEDGVIFLSIDEGEVANLRKVCDEIFGESNFISNFIWRSRSSISNDQLVSLNHNHTLVYAKDIESVVFGGDPLDEDEYDNPDGDERGPYKLVPIDANKPGGNTMYPIKNPKTGDDYFPPNGRSWAINKDQYEKLFADGRIAFGKTGNSAPKRKLFFKERMEKGDLNTPSSLVPYEVGTTKNGTTETMELFSGKKVFSYPKPLSFIKRLISYAAVRDGDIILDFFAGSSTTAHAAMEYSASIGIDLSYIMVQLPEEIAGETAVDKNCKELGFSNISQVSRQRLVLAGESLSRQFKKSKKVDIGFRLLKVDLSNFSDVDSSPGALNQQDLVASISNIRDGRNSEDLLFQVLLDWGVDLSLPITRQKLAGKTVFFVDGAEKHMALAACFDLDIDEAFVKQLAEYEPLRVVFRDAGFASDSVKINVEQIFAQKSPNTEVKVL